MDGIDIALLRSDGERKVERLSSAAFPYPAALRERLVEANIQASHLSDRTQRPGCLAEVEQTITQLHVEAVGKFLASANLNPQEVDLVGFHGQTVVHRPELGLTVQLGDGNYLARQTGIACVFDMRANDMAHGGQGAPLVPIYHRALAASLEGRGKDEGAIAFVNIGGISNITWIGDEMIAFDTGPGNALIDQWVQLHAGIPHDDGGRIAAEGVIDRELVEAYLCDPYFDRPVPKSLDRGDFTVPVAQAGSLETVARSLARTSAEAIMRACEHLPERPKLWVICGGGRHNPHIMNDLNALVANRDEKVLNAEEAGFDGDAMEAEAWAYLAIRSSKGLPISWPKTTGCTKPVSGGTMAMP